MLQGWFSMKLIPQIREKRMESHLKQIELSKITGISQAQLSEYRKRQPKPANILG